MNFASLNSENYRFLYQNPLQALFLENEKYYIQMKTLNSLKNPTRTEIITIVNRILMNQKKIKHSFIQTYIKQVFLHC